MTRDHCEYCTTEYAQIVAPDCRRAKPSGMLCLHCSEIFYQTGELGKWRWLGGKIMREDYSPRGTVRRD